MLDYGNNLRAQAEMAGVSVRDSNGRDWYPGFVSAFLRPIFCQGKGMLQWVALSGDTADIAKIDEAIIRNFPEDTSLVKWLKIVKGKVPQLGLPTRTCWLGYGNCVKMSLIINDMVKKGTVKTPLVIDRNHFDYGAIASPSQETEDTKDGSDAIADWPMINFALNAINGASWISFQQGEGQELVIHFTPAWLLWL